VWRKIWLTTWGCLATPARCSACRTTLTTALLVVNGELVAAAKREPGHVVGDGKHTIAELDDALSSQQTQIANLELLVKVLADRVKAISEATPGGDEDEAPPPHY